MFGSKKKKAVQAISRNVRPALALFQRHYGLPAHFWSHEYVLGFFAGQMHSHAKIATSGKISGHNLNWALVEGWGLLSGQNGQQLWQQTVDLSIDQDVAYLAGFDRGCLVIFLSIDKLKPEARLLEEVQTALKSANGDVRTASTLLLTDTFVEMDSRLNGYRELTTEDATIEKYVESVYQLLKRCGLRTNPETASDIIVAYKNENMSPHLCATMVGAHNAAHDYFRTPVLIVRASETAFQILQMLKTEKDANVISSEDWQFLCSIVSPFLDPSEEASKHAEFILGQLGDNCLTECVRPASEQQTHT